MDTSTVIILKGVENWNIWKFQMKVILKSKGVYEVIEGSVPVKSQDDTDGQIYLKVLSEHKKKDLKAQEIIVSRLEDAPMAHILTCDTAKEMWMKLCSVYEHTSEVSIHMLQKKFFNYSHSGKDISAYISGLEEIRTQLKQHNEEISDQMFMTKILMGLPSDYHHFISAWESVPSDKQNINELVSRLSIEEERTKSTGENSDSAFTSYKFKNRKTEDNKVKICYICKKKGHTAKNCFLKKNFDLKLCFHCNKPYHKAKDCYLRQKSQEKGTYQPRKTKSAYTSIATLGNEQVEDTEWYADSGASEHMTHSKSWLCNYKELQDPVKIRIANGAIMEAIGLGDINIKAFDGKRWSDGELKNVLFVPGLKCNLFSISSVTEKDYTFQIERNCCMVLKNEIVKILGKREGKLYKLLIKYEEEAFLGSYTNRIYDLHVWHERFAHQNIFQVRSTLMKHGIQFTDVKDFFCEPCIIGKEHTLPFPRSTRTAKYPGEVIHADLCGPMEEKSIGNSRYFLLLKDDFSHYRAVYFLKYKSEAKIKIRTFLELAANVTGNKVQVLRTDQGLEEVNKELEQFLENRGIRHQKSCSYTPQQNGRIERENRTIVELARTMLNAKCLGKELWAEAVATATYVINRTGTSTVKGKTPFELWFKETPNLKELHTFGSEAYVLVPKQRRRKWDPKGRKGIFVGYGENVKGYRVYFPEQRKVDISRNVIFKPDHETEEQQSRELKTNVNKNFQKEEKTMSMEDLTELDNSSEMKEKDDEKLELSRETDTVEDKSIQSVRPSREKKIPEKFKDFELYSAFSFLADADDPSSYEEAVQDPKWNDAIKRELLSLEQMNTWEEVECPPNIKLIDTRWIFRSKIDGTKKARLVARGFQENVTSEIYAPVARLSTIRMLISLALQKNWSIRQLDVPVAFLNGTLKEAIYIKPPEGANIHEGKVLKLNKALYGLKSAPRLWNDRFNKFALKNGFIRSKSDFCVYTKENLIMVIYVDDILLTGEQKNIEEAVLLLKNEFQTRDMGELKNYLGLQIERHSDKIKISQDKMIERILERFGMKDCKGSKIPMEKNFTPDTSEMVDKNMPYRELIGSLMYVSLGCRPDITFAVSYLSQYLDKPTESLWKAGKKVLRYLKETKSCGLYYMKGKSGIEAYTDSDWGSDPTTRKSMSGCVIFHYGNPIQWYSRKQKCVALSSTEAEYISAALASAELISVIQLAADIENKPKCPGRLYLDNQGAIHLCEGFENSKRSKHIDIKYHFIKDLVDNGQISIKYVPTHENISDLLTKSLTLTVYTNLKRLLNLRV